MGMAEATGGFHQVFSDRVTTPFESARGSEVPVVIAAQAGDREAFGCLYKSFAPMVHGILLARIPRTYVEDVLQDVFLLAYKTLPNLRNAAAFGGWLAMITRNCAVDHYRSNPQTQELNETQIDASSAFQESGEILEIIRQLPEAYGETLVLRLVEGMTGSEIAERTGLKPASVRVNLHRGMKLLRDKLTRTKVPGE